MTSVGGATVIVSPLAAVAPAVSLTCAVKLDVPAVVGLPAMVPFAASASPAGSVPDVSDHELAPAPPVAESANEYGTPTIPAGTALLEIVSTGTSTVIVSALVAVRPPLSATRTVKFEAPAAVGVPVIAPAALSANPAGSEPALTDHALAPLPPVASRF